jgi:transcriptional regulator with XRE-family HTH domain
VIVASKSKRARAITAFGEVLQEARTRRGLSQSSLALLVGIDPAHLDELESGTREPTLVLLFKLADALKVEPSALISRMESKLQ